MSNLNAHLNPYFGYTVCFHWINFILSIIVLKCNYIYAMPVLITLTSWLMLLVLMLLLHSLTTVDLLRPILSLAAFWMIWLTSLSVSISSLWLLQRILY